MAISTAGFDGTIDEAQFAILMSLAGVRYSVAGPNDLQVSPVPGNRQVSVATGVGYGVGVTVKSTAATPVNLPTPSAGQWQLIVVHRDWSTNAATIIALAGATTANTVPTLIPSVMPSAFAQNAGTVDDQALAWVWVSSTSTDVVVFDMRTSALTERLREQAIAISALQATVGGYSGYGAQITQLNQSLSDLPSTLTLDASRVSNQSKLVAGNSLKVGGRTIYVQAAAPSAPVDGDLWFW